MYSSRSKPPTLMPWSVIVTLDDSPTFWNRPAPAGRYIIGFSGFVQSLESNKLSGNADSWSEPVGAGVDIPNKDVDP